ncbi:phage holin family protein [Sphingomonas sp.]|uniref:phage holin family protein n=1 Tax=Sphingomonas sp. TaxID=28214 RepID=UPI0025F065F7|nr:phage holin family protein [Sphingomonas sp.]MBV9528517.1 phage holin family protein [Sphingomonas sp.]
MLKVPEQAQPAAPERPVGELVHQLIEDGKAYARAEVGLVKAIASAKAGALAMPAGLLAAALLLGLAAINALVLGVVLALARFVGPLLAGLIGTLIFAGVAGGLAWFAVGRIRRAL